MVPAVALFYWRMFPIIRELDARGQVRPEGYSKVLGGMIGAIILAFVGAIAAALLA